MEMEAGAFWVKEVTYPTCWQAQNSLVCLKALKEDQCGEHSKHSKHRTERGELGLEGYVRFCQESLVLS